MEVRPRYRALLETGLCVAILAVLPILALYPALIGLHVPMALQDVLFEAPWAEARTRETETAATPFTQLQARRYYPWFAELSRAAEAGESVRWNPNEACGTPFLAAWRTRTLSPFSVPFYLMPLHRAIAVSFLAKLLVAGLAAFYAMRRMGLSRALALLVAVTFQLGGPALVWAPFPLSDVAVWLPLLMLFAERAAMGQWRAWPAGGIAVGLMALGGDPQALACSLLFAAAYTLVRTAGRGAGPALRTAALTLAGGFGLGLALAAVQILPYIEFARLAAPSGLPLQTTFRAGDTAALLAPAVLAPSRAGDLPVALMLYTGVAPALLLVLWLAVRPYGHAALRRRMDAMALAVAAWTVLAAISVRLPGAVGPQHFLLVHAFAIPFVAAWAASEWLELDPDECKGALARLAVLIPILWGGGALLVLGQLGERGNGWGLQVILALCWAVLLLGLIGWTLLKPGARLFGYSAAALAAIALLAVQLPNSGATPAPSVFPDTSFTMTLREAGGRVTGSAALDRWPLFVNGIAQTGNPSGINLARYAEFMEQRVESPTFVRQTGADLLLLRKEDIQGPFAPLRPVLGVRHVFSAGAVLFEDKSANPRVWLAHAWRESGAGAAAAASPDDTPVVEANGAPVPEMPDPEELAAAGESPAVNVRHLGRDALRFGVSTTLPGLLVLNDTWYPGWHAEVNGRRQPLVRVNSLFRGVFVPTGESEVVFFYKPASHRMGLLLSAAAALATAYGLLMLARAGRRRTNPF